MLLIAQCGEHVWHVAKVPHLIVPSVLLEIARVDLLQTSIDAIDADLIGTEAYNWTMPQMSLVDCAVLLACVADV